LGIIAAGQATHVMLPFPSRPRWPCMVLYSVLEFKRMRLRVLLERHEQLMPWFVVQDKMTKQPDCKWAQRPDKILLTINVANLDEKTADIKVI